MLKPPSQVNKSSLQPKDWEEVEVRMRNLARLERVWGKSGAAMGSSSQLSSAGGLSSSSLSAGGEERERRLFAEALRDGYVLCQCVHNIRSSSERCLLTLNPLHPLGSSTSFFRTQSAVSTRVRTASCVPPTSPSSLRLALRSAFGTMTSSAGMTSLSPMLSRWRGSRSASLRYSS
ncbi:hypothetical protein IEO21_07945 [Rhodonia placenta]|uniref:Uncharacterized protein n=1 Tax=Rhodonia placenta TaxID=104341 RepID=A0A8H7NXK2_9APHY|nr:hypothetical protein IEO21_07945 [Postia placenta]